MSVIKNIKHHAKKIASLTAVSSILLSSNNFIGDSVFAQTQDTYVSENQNLLEAVDKNNLNPVSDDKNILTRTQSTELDTISSTDNLATPSLPQQDTNILPGEINYQRPNRLPQQDTNILPGEINQQQEINTLPGEINYQRPNRLPQQDTNILPGEINQQQDTNILPGEINYQRPNRLPQQDSNILPGEINQQEEINTLPGEVNYQRPNRLLPDERYATGADNEVILTASTSEVPFGKSIHFHFVGFRIVNDYLEDDRVGVRIVDQTQAGNFEVQYDVPVRNYTENSQEKLYFETDLDFTPVLNGEAAAPGVHTYKAYLYNLNNDSVNLASQDVHVTILPDSNMTELITGVDTIQGEMLQGLDELKNVPDAIEEIESSLDRLNEKQDDIERELHRLNKKQNHHRRHCGCCKYGRDIQINFID